jgi:hypothetical protein
MNTATTSQIAYFCYHRRDDNVLETCLRSLRSVSDCVIVIATDGVPDALAALLATAYGVQWDLVLPEQMQNRRAACKLERLGELTFKVSDGTQIMAADVDTYFLQDPFRAFAEHPQMDVGLTTRGYEHWSAINAGVVYLASVPHVRLYWLAWALAEIARPTWEPFVALRRQHGHESAGLDWWVDQDFLLACWEQRDRVRQTTGVRIEDVGPTYNYCPPSDLDPQAAEKIRTAYREKSVAVLHLKSRLKELIYAGLFEHAVTHHERGPNEWL